LALSFDMYSNQQKRSLGNVMVCLLVLRYALGRTTPRRIDSGLRFFRRIAQARE